jgi:hypothetical protein
MLLGRFLLVAVIFSSPAAAGVAGCPVFPRNNVWNTRVDSLPVHARSDAWVSSIGNDTALHADFGAGRWEGGPIGIPFGAVPSDQRPARISFDYEDESDPGPYPFPAKPRIEGGPRSDGDRHVLVVQREDCVLYETWSTYPNGDGSWSAGSGAAFDLRSNALRPAGWTSADAAGLPILPGVVRYGEVKNGRIRHALRFTARETQRAYVWPARHHASSTTDPDVPPMGARFRLKKSFDVTGFPAPMRVILVAMQTYGMFLADNGSDWYVTGAPNRNWDDEMLGDSFRRVQGSDFEAVDSSSLMIDRDSGAARQR